MFLHISVRFKFWETIIAAVRLQFTVSLTFSMTASLCYWLNYFCPPILIFRQGKLHS